MLVARRLIVSGRVQRVGFRWFTLEAAEREGITGWVRNTGDRRVEILAEGESEAMERFERAVRQGPVSARVDDVEVEMVAATGRFAGFTARG
jgi:acylphosphatase